LLPNQHRIPAHPAPPTQRSRQQRPNRTRRPVRPAAHHTGPGRIMTRSCSASPIAATPRRPAADVKAGRRPPAGLGLDTGENRRILAGCEHAENRNTLTTITHIMPMSGRRLPVATGIGGPTSSTAAAVAKRALMSYLPGGSVDGSVDSLGEGD